MPSFWGCRCCNKNPPIITLRILDITDGSEVWSRDDGSYDQYGHVFIDESDSVWTANQGASKYGLKRWTIADKLRSTSSQTYLYNSAFGQNNFAQSDGDGNVYFVDLEAFGADYRLTAIDPDGVELWQSQLADDMISAGWSLSSVTGILLDSSNGIIYSLSVMSKTIGGVVKYTAFFEAWNLSGTRTSYYQSALKSGPAYSIPIWVPFFDASGNLVGYTKSTGSPNYDGILTTFDASLSITSNAVAPMISADPAGGGGNYIYESFFQDSSGDYWGLWNRNTFGSKDFYIWKNDAQVVGNPESFHESGKLVGKWRFTSNKKIVLSYLGYGNQIVCIDLPTGAVEWTFTETISAANANTRLGFSANSRCVAVYGMRRNRHP